MKNDISDSLIEQVHNAASNQSALTISGGNSKNFYGNTVRGETVATASHSGIIKYQPSELVVTVRSGTLLTELETELKANNQMLAFEPPSHSTNSTIGGIIACSLSGPRRVACGSARDFVLGASIINGRAESLKFGGQVMKNVAGYDASRLMVGAQGTLGIITDISLKVLPINETEITVNINTEKERGFTQLRRWVRQGIPITASCYINDTLFLRIGSTSASVKQSLVTINKQFRTEQVDAVFWQTIKNQTHTFFTEQPAGDTTLWRCSHQPTTDFYGNSDNQLIEWNGALRWIYSDQNLHDIASTYGGHATRYPIDSDINPKDIFQPMSPALMKVHKRLKQAFDPDGILNPGRLYTDL